MILYKIKSWFAKQPYTPVSILKKLSADENFYIRGNVAYNPSTPAVILGKLSSDKQGYVRLNVALNPSTPNTILENLLTDTSWTIKEVAAERSHSISMNRQNN